MSRVAIRTLAVLAVALAAAIAFELKGLQSDDPTSRPSQRREAPLSAEDRTVLASDRSQDWVSAILARPLFSATRRPPPGTAASGAGVGMPRLSGVLVSQSGKRAIFAAPVGGKALVAGEGALIGGFVLQSISAGQVVLIGPGGTHVLRPSFDAAASASSKAASAALAPASTAGAGQPDTGQPSLFGLMRAEPPPLPGARSTQ